MKICVYGAGAIGGSLAARLSRAGARISVVARGAHGRAMREKGVVTLITADGRFSAPVHAVEDPRELPQQDVVIVAVKYPALPEIAQPLSKLLRPESRVAFAMNGIPWWFGDGLDVALPDTLIDSLDPGARLRCALDVEQVLGGVIYSSNEVVEPGVICNTSPRNRFIVGRPDGQPDAVAHELVELLRRAGYDAIESPSIRDELWIKMLMVAGTQSVSALTGCSLEPLVNDREARALMAAIMEETAATGRRLGLEIPDDIDQRLAYYEDKPVRTSMLQDFELGRPPELESSILAFVAIASAVSIPTPTMSTVATLVRMKRHCTQGVQRSGRPTA